MSSHLFPGFRPALAAAVFVALAALPASAGWHDPVSSEGTFAAAEAGAPVGGWAPFRGTGAGGPGVRLPPGGGARDPGAPPADGLEAVIGVDGRSRVRRTTASPARAIVQVVRKDASGDVWGCTGWMVSADTVVTAGHCVHPGRGGAKAFYKASTFKVVPGRNGRKAPYGTCGVRKTFSVKGWTEKGSSNHDYGALKLDCKVGRKTGWFGYAPALGTVDGRKVTIAGYPCDRTVGTQWRMSGKILGSTRQRVGYTIDTFGCQSGSPVYFATAKGPFALAVHTSAITSSSGAINAGTRITAAVARNVTAWRKAK